MRFKPWSGEHTSTIEIPTGRNLKIESHRMSAKKTTKSTKSAATAKDLKPKKDAKGGIGLLLPAVQKVREAAAR
jgi:hypothetical protein